MSAPTSFQVTAPSFRPDAVDDDHQKLYQYLHQYVVEKYQAKSESRPKSYPKLVCSIMASMVRGFYHSHYEIPSVEDLRGLMSALAIHNLRDRLARGRPDDQWLAELASHDQSAELIRESLEETLESMRPHNRRILELRMTGMEVDDISKETNRSRRTIERVLQNSCKSIIAVIPDSDPPES